MTDAPQGPGWWQASDGKWYPPEQAPGGATGSTGPADRPPGPGWWQASAGTWYPPAQAPGAGSGATSGSTGPADGPQGPGWWQASDGRWYAPTQPPGPTSTGGGAPPGWAPPTGPPGYAAVGVIPLAGPPGFEPIDALRYGWEKFKGQPGPIIIAMLISFLIGAAISGITYAITGSDATAATFGFEDAVPRAVLQIINWVVGSFIQMAIIRAGLGIARGQRVELSDMFKADQLLPYLGASILFAIAATIGTLLCVVPGLLVILFFHLFGFFILDQKKRVIDSFRASAAVVQPLIGRFIVFLLLCLITVIAGAIACGVGPLVAIPVVTIAQTYVYLRAQGQPVAA